MEIGNQIKRCVGTLKFKEGALYSFKVGEEVSVWKGYSIELVYYHYYFLLLVKTSPCVHLQGGPSE